MKEHPRYEVEEGINGCLLIKDTYDCDLTSLTKHALAFLEQQSSNQNMHRTLIVTDINGDEMVCEMFYATIQKIIRDKSVNSVIFIGNDLYSQKQLFDIQDKSFFKTTDEFLTSDTISKLHNEAILLKIAPTFHLNKILSHLQLLVHDTVLETNFDALFHNIDYFRSKLKPATKLMCMVKASAYGSGSIEVSRALQHYKCDYLAVAYVNEGVEIRCAGIHLPIMVLDPMPTALHQMFVYNLEPEVCSFLMLNKILEEAKQKGLTDYPIHIKIDSGMHRAGFEYDDLDKVLAILKSQKQLRVVSTFSHLAASEDPEMDNFTIGQIENFRRCAEKIKQSIGYPVMMHILNSSGIERFPEYQFDMVRLGVGLWGVNCRNEYLLRNVCTLKTKIIQIKKVKAGETVGYNRKGKITKDSLIGLLPIGYADGVNRSLGNGVGCVLYNGEKVSIVGNICMDLMMIDVTGLDVHEGAEVTVFGDQQTISDIAVKQGTIPYEVLTSIAPRVRRVYYRY
ncbi:MAG: alanine racemase [Sphingobacteriia bacterium]|jgi:Alr-MurF fusion protein|nr:alanine racemase [Sphingobacteriia bacterium]